MRTNASTIINYTSFMEICILLVLNLRSGRVTDRAFYDPKPENPIDEEGAGVIH